MSEFTGKDLVMSWVYSGGTISLGGDYRSCNWNPSVGQTDTSAGSDPNKTYLATQKDIACSITLLAQTGGTALEDALSEGVSGTLYISPEGTASGKRQYILPSFSQGGQYTYPYADLAMISCAFTPTAPYTRATH